MPIAARAVDLCAHLLEHVRELGHLGSRAAFSITVSPSARHAAISTFCVPFTVLRSNVTRPADERAAVAST
jgi:hypothetical protein